MILAEFLEAEKIGCLFEVLNGQYRLVQHVGYFSGVIDELRMIPDLFGCPDISCKYPSLLDLRML